MKYTLFNDVSMIYRVICIKAGQRAVKNPDLGRKAYVLIPYLQFE